MKQVRLKIFEGFEYTDAGIELIIRCRESDIKERQDFYKEIIKNINHKLTTDGENVFLKPCETFESVLEALWEFQKSLLPDGYILEKHTEGINHIKKRINGRYPKIEELNIVCDFYDPASSIITITSWEKA